MERMDLIESHKESLRKLYEVILLAFNILKDNPTVFVGGSNEYDPGTGRMVINESSSKLDLSISKDWIEIDEDKSILIVHDTTYAAMSPLEQTSEESEKGLLSYSQEKIIIDPTLVDEGILKLRNISRDMHNMESDDEILVKAGNTDFDNLITQGFNILGYLMHYVNACKNNVNELNQIYQLLQDINMKRDLALSSVARLKAKIETGKFEEKDKIEIEARLEHVNKKIIPILRYSQEKVHYDNETGDIVVIYRDFHVPFENEDIKVIDSEASSIKSREETIKKLYQYSKFLKESGSKTLLEQKLDELSMIIENSQDIYFKGSIQYVRIPSILSQHLPGITYESRFIERHTTGDGEISVVSLKGGLDNPLNDELNLLMSLCK